jgi:GMP synthase (glutamine-hydrolysing)
MSCEFELIRGYSNPILGICFGHQLLSLAKEFEPDRADFGSLKICKMQQPEADYFVDCLCFDSPFEFSSQAKLWVQNNHSQEVASGDALLRYFDIIAGSKHCAVQAIRHKSRKWFVVQFHPEVGMQSQTGEVLKHDEAVAVGGKSIGDFIRYCLRDGVGGG